MEPTKNNAREFTLVIIMLGVLTLLVAFILFTPISNSNLPYKDSKGVIDSTAYKSYLEDSKMYYQSSIEYKRNLLAIILTAFGAWVGAGAAYFFGRENLRESANSLLQLHQQMTGSAKLNLIKVRDIPPKPLDSNFDESATIKETIQKLEADFTKWFISINTAGKGYIISKEAVYQYIQKQSDALAKSDPAQTNDQIKTLLMTKTLKDIVPEIEKDKQMAHLINQYVDAKLDDNASNINNDMDVKGVFLGVIKDDKGTLVQYFTTSDIRKALLKI